MSNNAKLAQDLISSLELALPPVAVSITDVAPPNIPCYDGVVPAGCVFWQQAATRTFVTSAKDHALCSIGVHTHHLRQPALSHLTDLGETLKAMCDLDYVRPEEVAAIPVIKREVNYVVYGPLAQFPLFPEVVLLSPMPAKVSFSAKRLLASIRALPRPWAAPHAPSSLKRSVMEMRR
jgi:uncharacterized protein (DUF169 family)